MAWWGWLIIAAAVVAGGVVAVVTYRKARANGKSVLAAALAAASEGAERAIQYLAANGQPDLAHKIGSLIGETVAQTDPDVQNAVNTIHGSVKAGLAAAHPQGKSTRDLIRDAFAKLHNAEAPPA